LKRINTLYHKIYELGNLILADKKARKGKSKKKDIILFDQNKEENLLFLQKILINNQYKTSKYHIFKIYEDKERIIHKLPYYPDRIIHHAIMNILEPIFVSCFTADTYSCIKKRGVHKLLYKLKNSLKDKENTKFCLKIDIKKFYPSVNNEILKSLLRKKFKDSDLLNLLYEIIDSTSGLPLGNYLSQFLGNFYLTYFDHWIKEKLKIKYYFRYCDDVVILHSSKEFLHNVRLESQNYLKFNLKLELKSNYQIFPVEKRGIDFVGYKSFHDYILIRKRIKKNFIKMIKFRKNQKSIISYNGWLSHSNSINLKRKYL
jgi:RNA-directed DNA polymerase